MPAPVITVLTSATQGTGVAPLPKESVVNVVFSFTADNNCNIVAEWSPNNGGNWYTAVTHNAANGQNYAPGTGWSIYIDVEKSRAAASVSASTWTQWKVRLTATDRVTSAVSATVTQTGTSTVKSTRPVALSFNMPLWVGQAQAAAAPFAFVGKDYDASNVLQELTELQAGYFMRLSTNPADLDGGTVLAFRTFDESNTFSFGSQPEGQYTVYLRIYDQFYNASDIVSWSTTLQRSAPSGATVMLTGTNGSQDYTGIVIDPVTGAFSVSRDVTLRVAATSTHPTIPMYFQILSSSEVELTSNVGVTLPLTTVNLTQALKLTTNRSNPSGDNFNRDKTMTVAVLFTDAAGNQTSVSKTIRLNTRVYKVANKPMRKPDAQYRPILKYVNSGGQEVVVPQSVVLSSEQVRSWKDIYHPTTHGYPVDANGNVSLSAILANATLTSMQPTTQYDPVLLEPNGLTWKLVLDDDNRPITVNWTKSGTKNYANMESESVLNPRYWVIDNYGYPDYSLEFEWFDLNSEHFGPPFNRQSPYRGDVLVIYDASTSGSIVPDVVNGGWRLGDATKLKEIMAYTGSGTGVTNLTNGTSAGANANGAFITPLIKEMPRIVVMLYSDFSGTGSGFRIKSGKGRDKVFSNYDVDWNNGEVWVHMHSSLAPDGQVGAADTSEKRFYYDYYQNAPEVFLEEGSIIFNSVPLPTGSHGPWVDVDWAVHMIPWGTAPAVNTYVASHDDFVDYNDIKTYVCAETEDTPLPNSATLTELYEIHGKGRIISSAVWDKDRGVLEITPSGNNPTSRVVANYFAHTYLRLTNDGFGDLTFRDKIIVPDVIPQYPDYTWADVKIVNEGNADLKDMQIKFVPRGYDTNNDGNVVLTGDGVVDQVLDINRPWDVQKGTREETYDKQAMAIRPTYDFVAKLTKSTGGSSDGLQPNATAVAIFSTWQNRAYGNLPARGKAFGRTVWVLGGSAGSGYPANVSSGEKRNGLEVSGKYYSSLLI